MGLDLPTSLFTAGSPWVRWGSRRETRRGEADRSSRPAPRRVANAELSDAFFNSLWMQLPYRVEQSGPLGGFICTRYNQRRQGAALVTWTLVKS